MSNYGFIEITLKHPSAQPVEYFVYYQGYKPPSKLVECNISRPARSIPKPVIYKYKYTQARNIYLNNIAAMTTLETLIWTFISNLSLDEFDLLVRDPVKFEKQVWLYRLVGLLPQCKEAFQELCRRIIAHSKEHLRMNGHYLAFTQHPPLCIRIAGAEKGNGVFPLVALPPRTPLMPFTGIITYSDSHPDRYAAVQEPNPAFLYVDKRFPAARFDRTPTVHVIRNAHVIGNEGRAQEFTCDTFNERHYREIYGMVSNAVPYMRCNKLYAERFTVHPLFAPLLTHPLHLVSGIVHHNTLSDMGQLRCRLYQPMCTLTIFTSHATAFIATPTDRVHCPVLSSLCTDCRNVAAFINQPDAGEGANVECVDPIVYHKGLVYSIGHGVAQLFPIIITGENDIMAGEELTLDYMWKGRQ